MGQTTISAPFIFSAAPQDCYITWLRVRVPLLSHVGSYSERKTRRANYGWTVEFRTLNSRSSVR